MIVILVIIIIIMNNMIIILDLDNLKPIIDSHICLLVKVHHDDLKAVGARGGELVESFKAKPYFSCNKLSGIFLFATL